MKKLLKKLSRKLKRLFVKQPEKKVCKHCLKELPVSRFGPHANSKDGLQSWCRQCQRKYAVTYARKKKVIQGKPAEIVEAKLKAPKAELSDNLFNQPKAGETPWS